MLGVDIDSVLTLHAVVVVGWVPGGARPDLAAARLAAFCGDGSDAVDCADESTNK